MLNYVDPISLDSFDAMTVSMSLPLGLLWNVRMTPNVNPNSFHITFLEMALKTGLWLCGGFLRASIYAEIRL